MITILYPYRNRELNRIKRSLDSLNQQTEHNFKVLLVDYGSNFAIAKEVKNLTEQYSFVDYFYSYHCNQPWSRAKAINIGLQQIDTTYVFVADIDMIFSPDFVEKLYKIKNPNQSAYFKVGFLDQNESKQIKPFDKYKIAHSSTVGAQGLSLFPTEKLKAVNGFDEFLHFWGAEDEDVHNRLQNSGVQVLFYDSEILLLHQWHNSYRKNEKKSLTQELQLTNITRINQQHFLENKKNKVTVVNPNHWGKSITKLGFEALENHNLPTFILNKKKIIDHFLFVELPNFQNGILNIIFKTDDFQHSFKYKIKKILGKNVPVYYTLKEINDKILLHLISFYRDYPYSYKVSEDLKTIQLKIKKD